MCKPCPKDRFTEFAGEQALEPGLMISFQAPDGELPGVVTQVFSEAVEVDFNHPSAVTMLSLMCLFSASKIR